MKTIDIVSRISKALEKRDGTPDQAAKKIVEAVNVVKNYSAHQLSTAQDADELMPCPFCGSAAHFDHNDAGWWWIECSGCHVATEQSVSLMDDCKVKLCEMWNRRPSRPMSAEVEKSVETARERIERALEDINAALYGYQTDSSWMRPMRLSMEERARIYREAKLGLEDALKNFELIVVAFKEKV